MFVRSDWYKSIQTQEDLEDALRHFKSMPAYVGEYNGRLWAGSMNPPDKPRGRFEMLLDEYDDLLARFKTDGG